MTRWFIFDLVSAIPFDLIVGAFMNNEGWFKSSYDTGGAKKK